MPVRNGLARGATRVVGDVAWVEQGYLPPRLTVDALFAKAAALSKLPAGARRDGRPSAYVLVRAPRSAAG